ncbi:MAG: alpha/beta hydrolase [Methylophilaceae bacterium]|nr:alpha/beta hydrolase [Methylophilaceae bacterium]
MLETIELTVGREATACVVWLHGLGADGYDFVPVAEALHLPFGVRYVFPHAPVMPVTLNGGYRMRAWYDIYSMDIAARQDEAGIRNSQAEIEALLSAQLSQGMAAGRIVLAGFSQGGAIALQTALRHPARLAGVLALSTYLPLAHALEAECSDANRGLPIFMGHGVDDMIIPLHVAAKSRDRLAASGYAIEWHQYSMGHTVCEDEIADIRRFLTRVLGG